MTFITTLTTNTIQQSNLLGRLILNRETAEEIGHVKEFWLSTTNHQVMAIVSESGFLRRTMQFLRWGQVEAIGEDSILVSLLVETSGEPPQDSEVVIGHELWTDGGNKAGAITDYCFDLKTGEIVAYLFNSNGWQGITGGVYLLLPEAVLSTGTKRLIAKADHVKDAEQFSEGLKDKLDQATEFLKEDFAKTGRDMAALKDSGQSTVAQVKGKTQQVGTQMQATLSGIAEQVQEATQQVATQTQSTWAEAGKRIQHTAHGVAKQVHAKPKKVQKKPEKSSTPEAENPEHFEADNLDT